jgi:hypothetical protein
MNDWIPVYDPPPPDDYHVWAKPAPEPCPDCDCCSRRLCATALEENTACHFLGKSADFDLAFCPCWRTQPGSIPPNPSYPRGKAVR